MNVNTWGLWMICANGIRWLFNRDSSGGSAGWILASNPQAMGKPLFLWIIQGPCDRPFLFLGCGQQEYTGKGPNPTPVGTKKRAGEDRLCFIVRRESRILGP